MSSRRSLGGGALRDASNGRSSSRSRRSLGGGALARPETPQKDRLAALDEWRRSRTREPDAENRENDSKRARMQQGAPPLPPSSSSSFVEVSSATSGATALERYRMKKQLKLQQQQQDQQDHVFLNQTMTNSSGLVLSEDFDDESTMSLSTGAVSSTPTRRRLGPARRRSQAPPRENVETPKSNQTFTQLTTDQDTLSLSQNSESGSHTARSSSRQRSFLPRPETDLSKPPIDGSSHKNMDSENFEEGGGSAEAGLRSRLREAELRIQQLESDKMKLLVANAPLEARLQQKDEELEKKEIAWHEEAESLRQEVRKYHELYKDTKASCDAFEEELKQARLEARKASNAAVLRGNASDSSSWDRLRQYGHDRDLSELKDKLAEAQTEVNYLRGEKISLEKELHGHKIEIEALNRDLGQLQQDYDELAASSTEERDAVIKLEHLTVEHTATSAQLNATCQELADSKARAGAELKAMDLKHKDEMEKLRFDLSVATARAATAGVEEGEDSKAILLAKLEEHKRRVAELESEVLRGEELRRQMHNRIQELRGNIRVFVRTRPFLPGDGDQKDPAVDVSPDGESLSIKDARTNKSHNFSFDKVFPPSAGQDIVFREVADFVQSALDGYHVCLFSYGQTGSGKTHTMQGSGNNAMRGIIPRAVEQVVNHARLLQGKKWDFKLTASFLEIYNEELKDLLSGKESKKLSIKRSKEGKSFVDGLTEFKIDINETRIGMEQLDEIMARAARARSVASTAMNAQSSRSHSVFMLHLRGYNEDTGAEVHGALNLCDLAGSERLDRSEVGSDAKRLKETQAINKSLSCLGDVFNALATGASHVPYRNSKLTYLLQDCLSGDGKALMFVNLSPTVASSNESLCSLRFAQRVNQVELGKPTKNIQYNKN